MAYQHNDIQLQYQGYSNTQLLWKGNKVFELEQFSILNQENPTLQPIAEQMRLGFRVERFIGNDLQNMKDVKVLSENIQVRDKKQTIGELDCLLLVNGKPIHLEIVYKLYLYDETIGENEIERWIGGNRRDSFAKKLNKLKTKQLPLLYNSNTKTLLDSLNLKAEEIEQRVHFKAQLYIPYQANVDFKVLNPECLKGFYVRLQDLPRLKKFQFFIPYKRDWLVEPQLDAKWMNYKEFKDIIDSILIHKSYPLCWLKYPDETMEKFFVVWWD